MRWWALVLVLFVLSLFADPLKAQLRNAGTRAAPKTDEKLWGAWTRVSHKYGAWEPVTAGNGPFHLTITPGQFDCKRRGWGSHPFSYTVDPTKNPKTIHMVTTVKSIDGITGKTVEVHQETRRGIYKVEGDRLTICLELFGHGRPKRFSAFAPGKGYYLLSVYRRDKK